MSSPHCRLQVYQQSVSADPNGGEALGLCGPGEAPQLIDDEQTTYGGRWVLNPSGGLISTGIRWGPRVWRSAAN